MRKLAMFLLIVGVAVVLACLYGVGHDQVGYSISPEYYTKFKFIQLNLADSGAAQHMTQPRSAVVMVGVKSSWWMGLYIGILIGLFALVFRDADVMFQSAIQALGLLLFICIICVVIGYFYGHAFLSKQGARGWYPPHLIDKGAFIRVGSMHRFSYWGAVIGSLAGILCLLIKNYRSRRGGNSQ